MNLLNEVEILFLDGKITFDQFQEYLLEGKKGWLKNLFGRRKLRKKKTAQLISGQQNPNLHSNL